MRRRIGVWAGVVLSMLFCMPTARVAYPSGVRGTVCGFNVRTGTSLKDWDLMNGIKSKVKSSLRDQNALIPMMRNTNWPSHGAWSELKQPGVWLIRGSENAYASDELGYVQGRPSPAVFMDDDWLTALEQETGNPWIRTTVLAHELGHFRFSHPYGGGAATQWQREYDADQFAGHVICTLGASLAQGEELYRLIAEEGPENPDSHPSLTARLRAFRGGWRSGGCNIP